ncbi:MAG: VIT and VWA domain-containing protein [Rhodospirillaceae bacterium]
MIPRLLSGAVGAVVTVAFAAGQAGAARNDGPADLGGHVTAVVDGRTVLFPTLKTDVVADVQGDLATVTVTQTFANPMAEALNATYLFPLNRHAAVYAMTMTVGAEVVQAQIARREEARQTFEAGKRAGKSAALLEQHRPNMFTQEIANLMPGQPVKVTLKYTHTVPRLDGAYELVVPLVVGPRYVPPPTRPVVAGPGADPAPALEPGVWQLGPVPAYPGVAGLTVPATVDADRVSVTVNLSSGMPIRNVASATHPLAGDGDDRRRTVTLAGGRTVDNRDFVLRYTLADALPQAGLLTHRDGDGGTFSLLVEPPAEVADADATRREMVFVLDTSGSMAGVPIEASKTFMRHALKTMRPADAFRIIRFSGSASEFAAAALPATADNLAAGAAYVESLTADGGTEVLSGLQRVYGAPPPAGMLRLVVFLSDGYVGNEPDILRLVAERVGAGRLYAFGIGSSVNRYLIEEMARRGRGQSRVIDPTANSHEEAIRFATGLRTPVLTDIAIDWDGLDVSDVTPARIPDLFAGDSIRIQGRFTGAGRHVVKVAGKVNGRPATLATPVALPAGASGEGTAAIPLIWARTRIADDMREMSVPPSLRTTRLSDEDLKSRVIALGLGHSLVTQWTSFVAVSRQAVNADPAAAHDESVPLPMVKGVQATAYPMRGSGGFSGGATPEPAQILGYAAIGFLLLAGLGRAALRRRRAG